MEGRLSILLAGPGLPDSSRGAKSKCSDISFRLGDVDPQLPGIHARLMLAPLRSGVGATCINDGIGDFWRPDGLGI